MNKTGKDNESIIEKIELETVKRIPEIIQSELKKIILFGSYARGDYTEESDIDIAVLVECDRNGTAKYKDGLVALSAEMDLKNMVVVNFICLHIGNLTKRRSIILFMQI